MAHHKEVLWHARDLQSIIGGKWAGHVSGDLPITGVNYYTSQIEPGDLVFTTDPRTWRSSAYKDTNENIVRFFREKRASVVVAGRLPANYQCDQPVLLVEDTRQALDDLGRAGRERIRGTVVAVTGSAGKTTTKEITRFLLSQQDTTKGSRKNYNHGPGVSLMLAETPPGIRYGVYEFSVDLPNVTARKADIVKPDVVVITSIHPDHLLFYGSLEKLTDQKCLLFRSMPPGGVAVLNRDSALFGRQFLNAQEAGVDRVITFGVHESADMRAVDYSLQERSSVATVRFGGDETIIYVNQPGLHILMDSLGALATVHAAGGDWLRAADDIERAPVLGRRNEQYEIAVADGTITLIDDTFSANPASMQAGLGILGLCRPSFGGRRIAVMGEIKELGDASRQLHASLAPDVVNAGVDMLFTIGRDFASIWRDLPGRILGGHSEDPEQIAKAVVKEMRGGDIVWVKGSRRSSANLEKILSAILAAGETTKKSLPREHGKGSGDRSLVSAANRLHKSGRDREALEILFVGDTSFGENYQEQYERSGDTNILKERGYDASLEKVHDMLLKADLVIANLETPLTDLPSSPLAGKKTWVHRGDAAMTPYHLLKNNISVVGLANNHMFDYGIEGFLQTLESLRKAGLSFCGGGENVAEAGKPFIWQGRLTDRTFTLAVISVYAGPSQKSDTYGVYASDVKPGLNAIVFQRLRKEIRRVKEQFPDVYVVLFPHWGPNYQWRSERQAELATRMLEAGADLVLGHGSHMMQEIEWHGDRLVAYSIGNFVFNSKGRYEKLGAPPYSFMAKLRVEVHSGRFRKMLRFYPIVTDNRKTDYQPRFVAESECAEVISLLRSRNSATGDIPDAEWTQEASGKERRYFIQLLLDPEE